MYFQKYTMMVQKRSIDGFDVHLWSTPGVFMMKLTTWFPSPRGSKISIQIVVATTDEMTAGVYHSISNFRWLDGLKLLYTSTENSSENITRGKKAPNEKIADDFSESMKPIPSLVNMSM